jgi:hypothetical protein
MQFYRQKGNKTCDTSIIFTKTIIFHLERTNQILENESEIEVQYRPGACKSQPRFSK